MHDDVQWIKNGWIHRNRILVNGQPQYLSFPVQAGSSLADIRDRRLSDDLPGFAARAHRQLAAAYARAPRRDETLALFDRCLSGPERDVTDVAERSLQACNAALGLSTPIVRSSALDKDPATRGQDRVLEVLRVVGATHYLNPIGGLALYDRPSFAARGIRLDFLRALPCPYPQPGTSEFVPFLSILDLLMCNATAALPAQLAAFDLVG